MGWKQILHVRETGVESVGLHEIPSAYMATKFCHIYKDYAMLNAVLEE